MSDLVGKSIGNYEIKSKLGEGGMGTVYLGEHPLIGKRVAVKVLLEDLASNAEIVGRFFTEAKAVNDIGHQNIVDIVDFGKIKDDTGADLVYFIMEFLDGESLSSRLRRTGLYRHETTHAMLQCCSALQASHQKGIVHRDLKPDNIYLCTRGEDNNFIKLLDFGIAKLTGNDAGASNRTRTGLVIGTPWYMSPEQCEGKGNVDHRSDIYSLGVVMYELLTGRVPFPGDGFGEILVAHLTKTPERPSAIRNDVPAELDAIVMHALEKDREKRFQSMAEFSAALTEPEAHLESYLHGAPMPEPVIATAPADNRTMMAMEVPRQVTDSQPAIRATGSQPKTGARPTTGVKDPRRPTTLSGAAAEVFDGDTNVPPLRGRAPLYAAVGAAGLLIVGAIGFVVLHKTPTVTSGVPAAAVQSPPTPIVSDTVNITINSDPAGADVLRLDQGGAAAGTTPLHLVLKKGSPSFEIKLHLDGYRDQSRSVTSESEKELSVQLQKDQPTPAPAVVPVVHKPVHQAPASHAAVKHEVKRVVRPVGPKHKEKERTDDNGVLAPSF